MSQDLQKYVRTPMTNSDLRTYMSNELAKIQIATDTFFKMLGDLNVLIGALEGDFVPAVIGQTTAGVATYSIQKARFTKIGRLIVVQGCVAWTGHTGTGTMVIGPFPFPPDAGGFNPAPAILLSVGGIPAAAIGDCIATGIRVFAGPGSPPTQQAMTATGDIRFLAAYFSAT